MTLNFFRGHPTSSLLPNQSIHKAATKILLEPHEFDSLDPNNRHPLTYGSDEGAIWVREEVAKFSNKLYKPESVTKAEHINLTGGSSYGILNAFLQTTLPHNGYTKRAFVITPTYFLINRALTDAGFNGKLTAIHEVGTNSIDLDHLQKELEKYDTEEEANTEIIKDPKYDKGHKKVYRFVMYCIPDFSNPGGITMDLPTRLRLLELARKHDMLILTDEVYDLLDYTQPLDQLPEPLIPKLVHLDRLTQTDPTSFGNTLNNSTFSKTIAPGLRVGYQEAINSNLAGQLSAGGANVSGGTPSQLNTNILGELLKSGEFYQILQVFRKTFAYRSQILQKIIKEHLPEGTKATGFEGGYFQWVTLPEGYDARLIIKECKAQDDVILAGGDDFEVTGDEMGWGDSSFRLCLAFLEEHQLVEGIKKVGERIKVLYP
ncbi:hypothetical protein WICPIJ_001989 [Wickerhamomyces pijperi]|uniref:Aminotransferase class I/classII large domain-containing protein n=1 Tax=Wickerhamomyces pijperi TaxID=599730 RepID=A0A9P8QCA4_WICPI|nr:hypothetical protein WICPIJ_001989 [Wickerhamomyces pijperi]